MSKLYNNQYLTQVEELFVLMKVVFNNRWLDVTLLGSETDNPGHSNMKVKASKRTDICVESRKEVGREWGECWLYEKTTSTTARG